MHSTTEDRSTTDTIIPQSSQTRRRKRHVRPPPPPRPKLRPLSEKTFRECCTFWDFSNQMNQPTSHYDRAESLLFDTEELTWDNEGIRKSDLRGAMNQWLLRLLYRWGFKGCSTPGKNGDRYDAHYAPDEEVPILPEWLPKGLVGMKPYMSLAYVAE